jgi:hypothetical protein
MKNIKLIGLLTAVIAVVVIGGSALFGSPKPIACDAPCITSNKDVHEVLSQKQKKKAIIIASQKASVNPIAIKKPPIQGTDSTEEDYVVSSVKKSFDDDWCIASDDLNEADFEYAKALEEDWHQYIGRAFAKNSGGAIYHDDTHYPNNTSVASYQELPIEELQQRALDGDKWAMVAFIQNWYGDQDIKKEVAHELLVLGASYHAIEYFIMEELVAAKASFRRGEQVEKSTEHLVNAIAYVMLGLRDYNLSALTAYVSNISQDEIFQEYLNPTSLLGNAQGDIRARYIELTKSINQTRQEQSIVVERPPVAVKRLFEQRLAGYQFREGEVMDYLQSLQVTSDVDLNYTSCTKTYMARLTKIREQEGDL